MPRLPAMPYPMNKGQGKTFWTTGKDRSKKAGVTPKRTTITQNKEGVYVSPFYQHGFLFLGPYSWANFLALSGRGCCGAEQHQSGDRCASEQHDGSFNTASGFVALFSNTTGSFNTASGADALF